MNRPKNEKKRAAPGRHPGSRASGREPGWTGAPDRGAPAPGRFRFGVRNYVAFAAGLIAIVLGYVQLDNGSVTAAPLLLILGYAVLLPLGILLGWRNLD